MTTPLTWPPPVIDDVERVNTTKTKDQHPKDHNDLEVAVNTIIQFLGANPQGTYPDLTRRLLDLSTVINTQLTPIAGQIATLAAEIAVIQNTNYTLIHHVYYQRSTAEVWTVQHDLGYDPNASVLDDNGNVVFGDVAYATDHNSLTITFNMAFTGRVLLSN